MKIITEFLLFIIYFTICTDSQIIVSARLGSTVILPCKLIHLSSQKPHVQWSSNFEAVFERMGHEMFEAEGYKGRVDIPEDRLLNGNCSLVLKDVKASDEGVYESYLSVKRVRRAASTKWELVQTVKLEIDEDTNLPNEETHRSTYRKLHLIGAAGTKRPHPLVISICSIVSCFFFCLLKQY